MSEIKQFPVRFMAPALLKPYFNNVMVHNMDNVKKIAAAITKFGFDQPIVVDSSNCIIKGHGRYMGSLYLDLKLVPVIIRDDLTPEQVRASRISDNRLFEMGSIDEAMVRAELMDFKAEGGEGAGDIFDFMKPVVERDPVARGAKPASATDFTQGVMLVCPKCTYTFWETKNV